ncbi:MAG: hypothetical protein ACI8P3_000708 [Saprospiraceae bacterium]
MLLRGRTTKENLVNARLFIISTILFLFLGELSLWYVFKLGLSYKEKNANFYYVSPFVSTKHILATSRFTHLPNTTRLRVRPEFLYTDHFNSLGLREREISDVLLGSQDVRILALGDSFTEGTGAHQDSTWLRLLEHHLQFQSPGKKILTINGGIAGSDPIFDYRRLTETFLPLKPDLVILSINNSDIFEISLRGGFERYRLGHVVNRPPWWELFFASSLIFRGLTHAVFGYNLDLIKPSKKQRQFQEDKLHIIEAIDHFKVLAN